LQICWICSVGLVVDITDMNLAELTATEDAASAVGVVSNNAFMRAAGQVVRSTREGGRIFFKEGDLVARLTAFNASYLEAVALSTALGLQLTTRTLFGLSTGDSRFLLKV
jgi:hypothetical protein